MDRERLDPIVLDPITLPEFLDYVLGHHAALSCLVVCSSKRDFLDHYYGIVLDDSISTPSGVLPKRDNELAHRDLPQSSRARISAVAPSTLRFLASSQTLKVAFCPDITHLRAYLALYDFVAHLTRPNQLIHPVSATNTTPMLAVLNPLAVHKPTSAFSAQGLNRTFSAAVEAADRAGAKLVIAECPPYSAADESGEEQPLSSREVRHRVPIIRDPSDCPWNDELSILNISTKSFGTGERGWTGRTVSLRRIVGRWCKFVQLRSII